MDRAGSISPWQTLQYTEVSASEVPRFVGKLSSRKPKGSQAGVHVLDNRVARVLARQLSKNKS